MGKSVDIFMTFYIGDYLKKTTMLSCEEHGAYILLLFSLWQSGGYLPNDSQKLARICRVSCKKWEKIFSNISCFFICEENQISNKRVLEEIQEADLRRVRAGVNGAKGGRPPKEKPSGLPSGLPSGVPTSKPKTNPEKSSSPSPSHSSIPNGIEKENIKRKVRSIPAFIPPTYEEVFEYMRSLAERAMEDGYKGTKYYRFPKEEVQKFFEWYDTAGWKDRDMKPIENWKLKLVTWINKWIEKNPEMQIPTL